MNKKFDANSDFIVRLNNCSLEYIFDGSGEVNLPNLYSLTVPGIELSKFFQPEKNIGYFNWSILWFERNGLKLQNQP